MIVYLQNILEFQLIIFYTQIVELFIFFISALVVVPCCDTKKKVQVGKDQEKAQSEKDSGALCMFSYF